MCYFEANMPCRGTRSGRNARRKARTQFSPCEADARLRPELAEWEAVAIPVPTGFGQKQVLSEIATYLQSLLSDFRPSQSCMRACRPHTNG